MKRITYVVYFIMLETVFQEVLYIDLILIYNLSNGIFAILKELVSPSCSNTHILWYVSKRLYSQVTQLVSDLCDRIVDTE